jgi:hypothetical protein
MTSTLAAEWLYASDFMAQFGDRTPDEVVRQLRLCVKAGDHEGARRLLKMCGIVEALTWGPENGALN